MTNRANEELDTSIVVTSMSNIIRDELRSFSSEYWEPRFAADQMDAELKFRKNRVQRLREMRAEFENLMFGLGPEVV